MRVSGNPWFEKPQGYPTINKCTEDVTCISVFYYDVITCTHHLKGFYTAYYSRPRGLFMADVADPNKFTNPNRV